MSCTPTPTELSPSHPIPDSHPRSAVNRWENCHASTLVRRLRSVERTRRDRPGAKRKTRPILEAFSGKEIAQIPVGTAADLRAAVAAARVAQQGWAEDLSPAQRAEVLFEFARLVNRDAEALMDMVQAESGKARQYAQKRSSTPP